jgi:hypothetical protein
LSPLSAGATAFMSQWKSVYLCCYVIAVCLLFCAADAENLTLNTQLQESIAKIPTERTYSARAIAAQHLEQLTQNVDPEDVDDKTLAGLISLLDSPDDAVRAWTAVSLGHLGQRARSAIPKLLSVLPKSDCLYVTRSSAPAIRVAIVRLGGSPPPHPNCEKNGVRIR